MTVERGLMTADDLLRMPDDGMRHELIKGELRTMPPAGWGHGRQMIRFAASLDAYVESHDLGQVVAGDAGFRLARAPDTVRAPDVAFVRRDRLPSSDELAGFYAGAPDLVVEVISPNDLYTDVDEKVAEWLEHGALLVFVVNPRRRTVTVRRPGQPARTLGMDDVLDGEDVVPGWRLPVRELFDRM